METVDGVQSKHFQLDERHVDAVKTNNCFNEISDDDEVAIITAFHEETGCAAHTNSAFKVGDDNNENDGVTEPTKKLQTLQSKLKEGTCIKLANVPTSTAVALNKKLLLSHRLKETSGILRNFNSLPLFLYATADTMLENCDRTLYTTNNSNGSVIIGPINCLPLNTKIHHHAIPGQKTAANLATTSNAGGNALFQNHFTEHQMMGHHSPYSNNFPLHHSSSHHHLQSDQTKSLQELQHEVGALLEFRDLVIETFPDLKHKMASMSSSTPTAATTSVTLSGGNTLVGGLSNSSLASRREWEPGIRIKRKISNKEPSTSNTAAGNASGVSNGANVAGELSSTSLTRSRSNSHSCKKEPKSGENNSGSVIQDSGFSTETSSSKEGHSASSHNGAMAGPLGSNRLLCTESDDELLNLLDVIHRKSSRLREEVEQLQSYEQQNMTGCADTTVAVPADRTDETNSKSRTEVFNPTGLTPKTFREHVERINKEDIKQLRRERDRLLDKLAEMEAETLTGRIRAAKINDQVDELTNVKKNLEEQLKLAMAQKLELTSRIQQFQQQQQQLQSKNSSGQSDYSSQRNFSSSATTVLSHGSSGSHCEGNTSISTTTPLQSRRQNTFQPVVVEKHQNSPVAFHQSFVSDSKQTLTETPLGRLDGIVSTPGARNTKCRIVDSKRFDAILLETSVIELQRHLLTLTVQNQVLMQKLEQATKSKTHLVKRLDKSKEDVEDLRFQLEEKNIELEGTKAQLRVLESRMHSTTPSSSVTTTSYLHSQNDYETNRSSNSTILTLSRRNGSEVVSRSNTPLLQAGQMPAPSVTQISTPSMKAMIHLPMDEMQHHSSSTESAQDQEEKHPLDNSLISTSVGGISPFDQSLQTPCVQQAVKKFTASKPSKIPLPGSKTASYFIGKPPTGRPYTSGRTPSSTNLSSSPNASNKSSLSRSTGNLLYSKSPNSLKRADSAQSIRKDSTNTSMSTSRSSTSSSIPLATPPFTTSKLSHGTAINPSSRVLQNSPIPKQKRESLTVRMRQLDSLHRASKYNNTNDIFSTSSNSSNISNVVSSTPKSSISLSNGSQQFLRRATGGSAAPGNLVARRLNSCSGIGSRAPLRNSESINSKDNGAVNGNEQHSNNSGNPNVDSDSGKVRTLKSTFLGWLKI